MDWIEHEPPAESHYDVVACAICIAEENTPAAKALKAERRRADHLHVLVTTFLGDDPGTLLEAFEDVEPPKYAELMEENHDLHAKVRELSARREGRPARLLKKLRKREP